MTELEIYLDSLLVSNPRLRPLVEQLEREERKCLARAGGPEQQQRCREERLRFERFRRHETKQFVKAAMNICLERMGQSTALKQTKKDCLKEMMLSSGGW